MDRNWLKSRIIILQKKPIKPQQCDVACSLLTLLAALYYHRVHDVTTLDEVYTNCLKLEIVAEVALKYYQGMAIVANYWIVFHLKRSH